MSFGPWCFAGFESECDDCGAMIWEGDDMRSDNAGGWLCQECGATDD